MFQIQKSLYKIMLEYMKFFFQKLTSNNVTPEYAVTIRTLNTVTKMNTAEKL